MWRRRYRSFRLRPPQLKKKMLKVVKLKNEILKKHTHYHLYYFSTIIVFHCACPAPTKQSRRVSLCYTCPSTSSVRQHHHHHFPPYPHFFRLMLLSTKCRQGSEGCSRIHFFLFLFSNPFFNRPCKVGGGGWGR